MLGLSVLALVHLAAGAALSPRALSCPAAVSSLSAANVLPTASVFCSNYLGIQTKTVSATATVMAPTKWLTSTTFVTNTAVVQAPAIIKKVTTRTTVRGTVTPSTTTTTLLATSTVYVDSAGSPIAKRAVDDVDPLARRAAAVTVAAAAVKTPSYFSGQPRASISAACSCLSIPVPTFTRMATTTVTPTGTTNANTRTRQTTSTNPASTVTSIITNIIGKQVTAPAPIATFTSIVIQDVQSCPPADATTWVCPEGTGQDANNGTGTEISCPADSTDDSGDVWYGSCVYWSDDGSPDSDVVFTDSAGNTRSVSYGDDDSDDCPSWADYTCAAPSSRLVRKAAQLAARSARPARPTYDKPYSAKKGGHRAFPVPAPKRGGKLHKAAKSAH